MTRTAAELNAKSGRDPLSLLDHLSGTASDVDVLATRIGAVPSLIDPEFWSQARVAALLHDAGKAADGFQAMLRGGDPWGQRHEVLSLGWLPSPCAPDSAWFSVATAIVTHHRALTGAYSRRPPIVSYQQDTAEQLHRSLGQLPENACKDLTAWLQATIVDLPQHSDTIQIVARAHEWVEAILAHHELEAAPHAGLRAVLLQGALTWADRINSSGHRPDDTLNLTANYLQDRLVAAGRRPRPHQTAAAETTGHAIIQAATGTGKTEAGLAWAAAQLAQLPGHPRLTWVLPYTASINAMVARLATHLANPSTGEPQPVGILHGRSTAAYLEQAADDTELSPAAQDQRARAKAAATRLAADRLRVSTPYQLTRGCLGGPGHSMTLLNQANSLLVFDELHAYDPVVCGHIVAAMALWEQLGACIAVVTATLPPPLTDLITSRLTNPVTTITGPPTPPRHTLVWEPTPLDHPDCLQQIRTELAEGRSVLVIANTVATARALHAKLADDAITAASGDPDAALLLHSRFRSLDRSTIERRLRSRYQPDSHSPGLLVATQTVEVSLDISFDIGHTELAPVESVAQRAGRVNRDGSADTPAPFHVHDTDTNLPYQQGAIDAARDALENHGNRPFNETDIQAWLDTAYSTPWGDGWTAEANQAADGFARSFCTYTRPHDDRSHLADRFDDQFDGVEAILTTDLDTYRSLQQQGRWTEASRHHIPLPRHLRSLLSHSGQLARSGPSEPWVIDAAYDPDNGLDHTLRGPAADPIL